MKYYVSNNWGNIVIQCQAKDEFGNWRDVKQDKPNINNFHDKNFIQGLQVLNMVLKKPEGDFETEIRYKMLVNEPPDYPSEKFIYSNPHKGRIDKLLLVK